MRSKLTAVIAVTIVAGLGAYALNERDRPPTDSELLAELTKQRAARIQELEDYVELGVFPHNHELKGKRQPYLMDSHGSLCAVAYLVAASQVEGFEYERFRTINRTESTDSSRTEERENAEYEDVSHLFQALAKANNKIRMMDVEDGPIAEWVLDSGLTLEECALIQPGYDFMDDYERRGDRDLVIGDVGEPLPISDAQKVVEADKKRISAHLTAVLKTLKAQTDESLATALARLKTSRGSATAQ